MPPPCSVKLLNSDLSSDITARHHIPELDTNIMPSAKRAIRIGGASGGFTDRQRAIHDLAKNAEVDVIVGGMSILNQSLLN